MYLHVSPLRVSHQLCPHSEQLCSASDLLPDSSEMVEMLILQHVVITAGPLSLPRIIFPLKRREEPRIRAHIYQVVHWGKQFTAQTSPPYTCLQEGIFRLANAEKDADISAPTKCLDAAFRSVLLSVIWSRIRVRYETVL